MATRLDYNEFLEKNELVLRPETTDSDMEATVESFPFSKLSGTGQIPYLKEKPQGVKNGQLWMERDGLHIYYNGTEKIVSGS